MQRHLLVPVLAACAGLALPAAAQAQYGSPAQNSDQVPTAPPRGGDPIVQYNRELLAILRTPGAQPATVHPTRSLALVHVAQYERSGGILPFLRRYLFECLTVGYSASPLELEAIAVTARVCAE